MPKPILDIAVLSAGRRDLLSVCIDHILLQMKPEYSLTIYNNGHPSKEYEEVYKKLPETAKVKRANVDEGFPVGANNVIRSGTAPLVLFVTDDIFIHPSAIETLLNRMKDQSIGICGYKFTFPEDSTDPSRPAGKVQHVGMATSVRGDMIHPMIGWSADNPKCCVSREVMAVTGASFMVRRDVFNRVGGFRREYGRGYYEDMDLCFSIREVGYRVFFDAEAKATHGVGQTFKNVQQPLPIQQNQMIFRARWLSSMAWSEWEMW